MVDQIQNQKAASKDSKPNFVNFDQSCTHSLTEWRR
uniref:Uncharacterized protein n=1 Tax=Arundo donax TaxID=35708 RepID=A0A0A9EK08_ARUDO